MTCRRGRGAWQVLLVLIAACLPGSACSRPPANAPQADASWTLTPEAAIVGPATLTLTLRSPSRDPLRGAAVHLEGHMSHAGMAPILAEGTERAPGVYDVPFAFTMQGDWVLLVSARLPGGERVERRIDVANVRPAG